MEQITNSLEETQQLAARLAKQYNNQGGVIALVGDLGAGKTAFTQGFSKALGIRDKIISPSFVLIRQHQIPKTDRWLFHLDLYRLERITDFDQLGLEEIFSNPKNIVVIEWAEKILDQLPPNTLKITFEKEQSKNKRKITWG